MALCPADFNRMFYGSPMGRLMGRFLSEDPFCRVLTPYWLDQPLLQECNIGNAVGKVVDDKEKFGVAVNVAQFRPDELSVSLNNQQLIVEGHHEERGDEVGRIERHFVRKYSIPDDVNVDSLESHLSDDGVLSVLAKKKTASNSNTRTIPIKAMAADHKPLKPAEDGEGVKKK